MNSGSLLKQKSPLANDSSGKNDPVLSSSNQMERSSGLLKRAVIPSSHEELAGGIDSSRSRTAEASPGTMPRFSSGQRSSPVGSSDANKKSSGRVVANIKNYESALKAIKSLMMKERVH